MTNFEKPLTEGYEFKPNLYFQNGWKLFKEEAGTYIGMTFLFFLIQIIVGLIPVLNFFNNILSSVLIAGYYIYARNQKRNQQQPKHFFEGFYYLKDVFLYLLTLFAILVPLLVLVFLSANFSSEYYELVAKALSSNDPEVMRQLSDIGESPSPNFFIAFFLFMLLAIYIGLSYIFTIPLIVDAKLGFWKAMELSRKTVGMHFFSYLITAIALGVLFVLGTIMTCFVGVLFLTPFTYCILFEAYNEIFKVDEPEDNSLNIIQ